jgi:hypothetical protein
MRAQQATFNRDVVARYAYQLMVKSHQEHTLELSTCYIVIINPKRTR